MLSLLPEEVMGQVSNPDKLALEPTLLNTSTNTEPQGRGADRPEGGGRSQAHPLLVWLRSSIFCGESGSTLQSVWGELHRALLGGTARDAGSARSASGLETGLHELQSWPQGIQKDAAQSRVW